MGKEEPESFVPDASDELIKDKREAMEMAYAMDPYAVLAINAEKAGMSELAERYKTEGGAAAEEALHEWRKKKKEIEEWVGGIIDNLVAEASKTGVSGRPDFHVWTSKEEQRVRIPYLDADYFQTLANILGVKELPYSLETANDKSLYTTHMTSLRGMTLRLHRDGDGPERIKKVLAQFHDSSAWEGVLASQKYAEETARRKAEQMEEKKE